MKPSQKYSKKAEAKAGQNIVSEKTEAYTRSQIAALEVQEVGEERIAEIKNDDSYLHTTSIIVGKTDKAEWQMTAVEKMNMARNGLSKRDLESLKSKTNLDYDKLSTLLSTTRATLINKKGTEHFSVALSERIVSIADIYSYGFEVFEDVTKFNEWVFKPNRALGGKQPFELLDNQFGREEIKNLIGRIDYGVYS
ncbi:type II RES/Xre toxin-antitoxin system antitoxin [Mucilaginibacter arboris]|nr:antitoxin Xre/MbcA/ParS toxin-binding domain-containing protein [Mucilaginibacter arboris]